MSIELFREMCRAASLSPAQPNTPAGPCTNASCGMCQLGSKLSFYVAAVLTKEVCCFIKPMYIQFTTFMSHITELSAPSYDAAAAPRSGSSTAGPYKHCIHNSSSGCMGNMEDQRNVH